MKQSKLKSFTKKTTNGQHDFYEGQHGRLYKFYVEFEDGTKGVASAKSESPTWILNTEYTFDAKDNQYGTLISGMKKVVAESSGYKEHDVDEAIKICKQVAMACAIEYMRIKKISCSASDFWKVTKYFLHLLLPYTKERKSNILACSVLKMIISTCETGILITGTTPIVKLDDVQPVFAQFIERISADDTTMGTT